MRRPRLCQLGSMRRSSLSATPASLNCGGGACLSPPLLAGLQRCLALVCYCLLALALCLQMLRPAPRLTATPARLYHGGSVSLLISGWRLRWRCPRRRRLASCRSRTVRTWGRGL